MKHDSENGHPNHLTEEDHLYYTLGEGIGHVIEYAAEHKIECLKWAHLYKEVAKEGAGAIKHVFRFSEQRAEGEGVLSSLYETVALHGIDRLVIGSLGLPGLLLLVGSDFASLVKDDIERDWQTTCETYAERRKIFGDEFANDDIDRQSDMVWLVRSLAAFKSAKEGLLDVGRMVGRAFTEGSALMAEVEGHEAEMEAEAVSMMLHQADRGLSALVDGGKAIGHAFAEGSAIMADIERRDAEAEVEACSMMFRHLKAGCANAFTAIGNLGEQAVNLLRRIRSEDIEEAVPVPTLESSVVAEVEQESSSDELTAKLDGLLSKIVSMDVIAQDAMHPVTGFEPNSILDFGVGVVNDRPSFEVRAEAGDAKVKVGLGAGGLGVGVSLAFETVPLATVLPVAAVAAVAYGAVYYFKRKKRKRRQREQKRRERHERDRLFEQQLPDKVAKIREFYLANGVILSQENESELSRQLRNINKHREVIREKEPGLGGRKHDRVADEIRAQKSSITWHQERIDSICNLPLRTLQEAAQLFQELATTETEEEVSGEEFRRIIDKINPIRAQLTAEPLNQALHLLGASYALLGDAEAIPASKQAFEELLEQDPTNVAAHTYLATFAKREQDHAGMMEHAEQAFLLNPDRQPADYLFVADACLLADEKSRALDYLEDLHVFLGDEAQVKNDLQAAKEHYRIVLGTNSENMRAIEGLVTTLHESCTRKDALDQLEEEVGETSLEQMQHQSAEEIYDEIIFLGDFCIEKGLDIETVRTVWGSAVINKAEALLGENNELATEQLVALCESKKSLLDVEQSRELLMVLAQSHCQNELWDQASQTYTEILLYNPEDELILARMGEIQERMREELAEENLLARFEELKEGTTVEIERDEDAVEAELAFRMEMLEQPETDGEIEEDEPVNFAELLTRRGLLSSTEEQEGEEESEQILVPEI